VAEGRVDVQRRGQQLAGMALDESRGIVYVPTGSAASDFYGADRIGDNLYANSLLALDAATGKRIWHFQFVRHDMWDRDLPSPPSLVTIQQNGRTIDAVAQATKHGYVFVFDRVTGTPLFPIEYRTFPASTVPGEVANGVQPIPTKPRPFARQLLTENLLSSRTPDVHAWALEQFKTFRSEGQFVPLSIEKQTVVFPGFDGGAEWGGQAFDPQTGLYYVNANDLAWTGGLSPNTGGQSGQALYLQHCASCHRDDRVGTPPAIPSLVGVADRRTFTEMVALVRSGSGRMAGFRRSTRCRSTRSCSTPPPGRMPPPAAGGRRRRRCGRSGRRGARGDAAESAHQQQLPFHRLPEVSRSRWLPCDLTTVGTLSAINLNTGEYAWQVPLGEYPELVAQGLKNTGSENYGGPVVTAGGLVFIGATNNDRKLRAFDKTTGALLWETVMPGPGRATPAVFEVNGRQYVAIALGGVGGGGRGAAAGTAAAPTNGKYIAFALPRR
jgi:quinoprotein glucose dehydrogenase